MMIELTVRIHDDVAAHLAPIYDHLPALLQKIAWSMPSMMGDAALPDALTSEASTSVVYADVLDFLVTTPTPEAILAYKVSKETQTRLRTLLEKNREEGLSPAEEAELDTFEQIEQMMMFLKARAKYDKDRWKNDPWYS